MIADDFAKAERDRLCDLLLAVGPDAPTLCDGWDAHDLAAHLYVREQDPIAMPGVAIEALSGVTERRMAAIRERWPFGILVEILRGGPHGLSLFRIPGLGGQLNALEYFVHHEDVRRGAGPVDPRELGATADDLLWSRAASMGRLLVRSEPVRLIIERDDSASTKGAGARAHLHSGTPIVTVVGEPGEVVLWLFGRRTAAEVELIGTDEVVQALLEN